MTATPEYVERRLSERGQPAGGTTGQVLAKATDVDYSATWQNVAAVIPDGAITTDMIANDAITSAKIALGAVNDLDVAAGAGIQVSKLAAGTAGQILQSNATPTTVWVTVTGDVTISNTGLTSIASGVIVEADLATTTGALAGAWNADTTTAGFTNVTGGNLSRRWLKIGKTLYLRAWFTAGTATAAGVCDFTLPASLSAQSARAQFYHGANGTTLVSCFTPTLSPTIVRVTSSTAGANFAGGASLASIQINGVIELA